MTKSTHHQRRILLCVTGMSSQIVTETVYALALQHDFMPQEIHLLTTQEGADRAQLTLLGKEPGWLGRLLAEYALPQIESVKIHVLKDAEGHALKDIRTLSDNEVAADRITELVRQLTVDPLTAVHASIAGGRKTMGFYLGYAMSLFGRPQDRLSHVLVSSLFESNQNFYYPSRTSRIIYSRTPDEKPLDTREAEVTLANIPFVRMRDELNDVILNQGVSFSVAVAQAQRALEPPVLILDASTRNICCGSTVISLPPVEYACYAWLARRALQGKEPIRWNDINTEEINAFLAEYPKADTLSGNYERVEEAVNAAVKNATASDYFDQRRSKANTELTKAMGKRVAAPYLITALGKRPLTHYLLQLTPGQIKFDIVNDPE